MRGTDAATGSTATGSFQTAGPPHDPPVRIDAGGRCIIDLSQPYVIRGRLAGVLEIDYRIFVDGPCGSPPATFDEYWIAHGTFIGQVGEEDASASFLYTADVWEGGEVEGLIVFGPGLEGELRVFGNFADGLLHYEGWVD